MTTAAINNAKKFELVVNSYGGVFRVATQFMIFDKQHKAYKRGERALIAASFVSNPESVLAMSSSVVNGNTVSMGGFDYSRGDKPFHRMDRKIGEGDLAQGIVYDSRCTIYGLEPATPPDAEAEKGAAPKAQPLQSSYIIAPDGNLEEAVSEYMISAFGLPVEWKDEYFRLFFHRLFPLTILVNPDFEHLTPSLKATKLETSEEQVLNIMSAALQYGQLKIPESDVQGTFNPNWSMKEYMMANNEAMAAKLSEMQPRHTIDQPLDRSIATMKRIPFPTQAHMIQALVNGFEEESSLICSSDMGTGKTIQSLGVAHVMHERRKKNGAKTGMTILISAPGITLSKWKNKEIKSTLPYAKTTIIKDDKQVLALYKKFRNGYRTPAGQMEIYLVGLDRAKYDAEPYYAGVWKRMQSNKTEYAFHCPDCNREQAYHEHNTMNLASWADLSNVKMPTLEELEEARMKKTLQPNGLPKGFSPSWNRSKRFRTCMGEDGESCGAILYRPAVKSREETRRKPRANISRILKRFNGLFDLYICDEVHKSKGSGSGRGDAFASMVKAAKLNLLLTGTLVNGKSTSIKEILWRTDAKSLIKRGFSDSTSDMAWARKYGKVTYHMNHDEDDQGAVVRKRGRGGAKPTEEPGIAPHMTAEFLLHKTGFMELSDLGLPLVELKEIPVFVDMDPEHAQAYEVFHKDLFDACKQATAATKSVGAWSKFIPSTLMYADRPDLGAVVEIAGNPFYAPRLDGTHAKERELVKIVKSELQENRGCVIYNTYTGKYGMNERLQDVLHRHGIRSVILDEGNLDKRAEVLEQLEADGEMVIITNMKNVEVGLDLLFWPTIIDYQLSYEVSIFRQSNRRNWRIGQDRECRVYILAYNGSQQISQFMKVMSGRGHALLTEGRLDRSELARFSRDEQSSLASDLADCFATSDLADSWRELAAKDLADVEIVQEGDFKQIIEQRMKTLANETLRLCGVQIIDEVKPVEVIRPVNPFDALDTTEEDLFSISDEWASFFTATLTKEEEAELFWTDEEEEAQLSFFDLAV